MSGGAVISLPDLGIGCGTELAGILGSLAPTGIALVVDCLTDASAH